MTHREVAAKMMAAEREAEEMVEAVLHLQVVAEPVAL
jgi:hypothetical protein